MQHKDHITETSLNRSGYLSSLQRSLRSEYDAYVKGHISEEEYIKRIKPIDRNIDRLEMSILSCKLSLEDTAGAG